MTPEQAAAVAGMKKHGWAVLYQLHGNVVMRQLRKKLTRTGPGKIIWDYVKIDKEGNLMLY